MRGPRRETRSVPSQNFEHCAIRPIRGEEATSFGAIRKGDAQGTNQGGVGCCRPKLTPRQQAEIPIRQQGRPAMPNNVDGNRPSNSESDRPLLRELFAVGAQTAGLRWELWSRTVVPMLVKRMPAPMPGQSKTASSPPIDLHAADHRVHRFRNLNSCPYCHSSIVLHRSSPESQPKPKLYLPRCQHFEARHQRIPILAMLYINRIGAASNPPTTAKRRPHVLQKRKLRNEPEKAAQPQLHKSFASKKTNLKPLFAAVGVSPPQHPPQQELNPTAHTCFNRNYTLPGGPIG